MRGVLFGGVLLVAIYVLVQEPVAGRLGPLARVPANIARRFLDPTVPAFGPRGEPLDAPLPAEPAVPSSPAGPDYPAPSTIPI